jgi:hypothetical protein
MAIVAAPQEDVTRVWLAAVVISLAAIALFWHRSREQSRWDRYFTGLKQQPGIVVTEIEKRGDLWVVSGLKGPEAPDPVGLTRRDGVDPSGVRYQREPFLSLNTAFAVDEVRL